MVLSHVELLILNNVCELSFSTHIGNVSVSLSADEITSCTLSCIDAVLSIYLPIMSTPCGDLDMCASSCSNISKVTTK